MGSKDRPETVSVKTVRLEVSSEGPIRRVTRRREAKQESGGKGFQTSTSSRARGLRGLTGSGREWRLLCEGEQVAMQRSQKEEKKERQRRGGRESRQECGETRVVTVRGRCYGGMAAWRRTEGRVRDGPGHSAPAHSHRCCPLLSLFFASAPPAGQSIGVDYASAAKEKINIQVPGRIGAALPLLLWLPLRLAIHRRQPRRTTLHRSFVEARPQAEEIACAGPQTPRF